MSEKSNYQWKARIRNYKREKHSVVSNEAIIHPLRIASSSLVNADVRDKKGQNGYIAIVKEEEKTSGNISNTNSRITKNKKLANSQKKEPEFIDPLGVAVVDGVGDVDSGDPLSRLSFDSSFDSKDAPLLNSLAEADMDETGLTAPSEPELHGFECWSTRRQFILQQYTTSEKLSIQTSFLAGGMPLESVISVTDRTGHRLEQFDEQNSMRRVADLSQQEYVNKINQLNSALITAWAEDQRVQSVKVVIQCAKLLADCSVPQFYPSQFVLITDILDCFGKLVYDRLWSKANLELKAQNKCQLGRVFDPDDVPETTKETVRNWFYKIASIRELLPRFYVETAILRSMRFLVRSSQTWAPTLSRLAGVVRGIANPLVAAYARCYLCRVGMVLDATNRQFVWQSLHDWLQVYKPITTDKKAPESRLLWPALEWLVQCLTYKATDDDLLPLWEYCKQSEKRALLLTPILNAFPARYLASNALEVCEIVLAPGQDQSGSLKTFGQRLLSAEPSPDVNRALLRQVWKSLMRFRSLNEYISCAEVWLEFTCRHFGTREINTLLEDIIRHVMPDMAYIDYYPQLLSMLNRMVNNQPNLQILLTMERFVAFLDLFRKDSIRLQACHSLLGAFVRCQFNYSSAKDDMTLANHIMNLCKSLHDSLNTLSLEDERRVAMQLICKALDRFRFESDPEQMLSFLVEARGNFSNLDEIIEYLIHRVNCLAIETREQVKGRHSRKTAYFVRACVAYTYITIPSIVDHFVRLKLYNESSSVALINGCLPQADALLKAAVSLIAEVPPTVSVSANRKKSTEPRVVENVENLLSLLLLVPDPPEQGQPLYLLKGLLNALQKYPWSDNFDYKAVILIKFLSCLSSAAQPDYLYHIDSIESNDTLYGGSDEFVQIVNSTASEVLTLLLSHLKMLQSTQQYKRLAIVALDLLECILHHGELHEMSKLAVQLWKLAQQHGVADKNRLHNIMMFVNGKVQTGRDSAWRDFVERIKS